MSSATEKMYAESFRVALSFSKLVLENLPNSTKQAVGKEPSFDEKKKMMSVEFAIFNDNEVKQWAQELKKNFEIKKYGWAEKRLCLAVCEIYLSITTILSGHSERGREGEKAIGQINNSGMNIIKSPRLRAKKSIPVDYFVSRMANVADFSREDMIFIWETVIKLMVDGKAGEFFDDYLIMGLA